MQQQQNYYYGHEGAADFSEHLADHAQYAPGQQDPFRALPMSQDPEMAEVGRPSGDYSDGGAYWAPGARTSTGAAAGGAYGGMDEWDEPTGALLSPLSLPSSHPPD
jgi:hypothetical protein